jgi:hypothetical protein
MGRSTDSIMLAVRHDSSCTSPPDIIGEAMSRYLIERDFPEGLHIPPDEGGANLCQKVVENNAEDGVILTSTIPQGRAG